MEEEFLEEDSALDSDEENESAAPVAPLDMRRMLDDVLEERKLRRQLRDYDFDLDD